MSADQLASWLGIPPLTYNTRNVYNGGTESLCQSRISSYRVLLFMNISAMTIPLLIKLRQVFVDFVGVFCFF